MSHPPFRQAGHLKDNFFTEGSSRQEHHPARPEDRRRRLRDIALTAFGKGTGALTEHLVKLGAAAAGPVIEHSGRVIAASNLVGATLLGNLAGQLSGSPAETVGIGVAAAVAGGLIQKGADAGLRKLFRKPGREDELAAKVEEYGKRIDALERALAEKQANIAQPRRPSGPMRRRGVRSNLAHSPRHRGPHRGGSTRDFGR